MLISQIHLQLQPATMEGGVLEPTVPCCAGCDGLSNEHRLLIEVTVAMAIAAGPRVQATKWPAGAGQPLSAPTPMSPHAAAGRGTPELAEGGPSTQDNCIPSSRHAPRGCMGSTAVGLAPEPGGQTPPGPRTLLTGHKALELPRPGSYPTASPHPGLQPRPTVHAAAAYSFPHTQASELPAVSGASSLVGQSLRPPDGPPGPPAPPPRPSSIPAVQVRPALVPQATVLHMPHGVLGTCIQFARSPMVGSDQWRDTLDRTVGE
jgi:hypothetical protein